MLEIHERLIEPLRTTLDTSGAFHYAWVIPYGIRTLAFVAVYSRFLARLPERTRWLFLASGAIFVGAGLALGNLWQ